MTYKELMYESLTGLLEDDETLRYPVYGTLIQGSMHHFGYFGLTQKYLLVALLQDSKKIISMVTRVPLDVKREKIRRSIIPLQYIITIKFQEGRPFKARVSKIVYGIECQEENLKGFFDFLRQWQA